MLPRLKYRNPSVPITVKRHKDPAGPCLLHIYTAPSTPNTVAPDSTTPTDVPDTAPAHTFNVRDLPHSQILATLVKATGATEIQPTPEEQQELLEVEEDKARSQADRVLVREKLVKQKREDELLRMARGELAG